jgi:acetamidase/formamidase
MLELMTREHGLERRDALALASVVVDLHITQLVNGTKGVHAVLPDGTLDAGRPCKPAEQDKA